MSLAFSIQQWAVWPPDTSEPDNAALAKKLLADIPPMLKRRLSPLARMVFCAVAQCMEKQQSMPVVFSSAHGELAKSLTMMKQIEAGEEISPTLFSLSVHNAIAGLISIIYHNQQPFTVLAPGKEGIAAGFIEAIGILHEGAEQVMLIFYDEPLPEFYPPQPFALSSDIALAMVLRISLPLSDNYLALTRSPETSAMINEQPLQLPKLRDFVSSAQAELLLHAAGGGWKWTKNG